MSDKDLQRVTECVSDIGHGPSPRRVLPPRRNHITQKVKVAGQRTLYLSVHDDDQPVEIFLRVKGSDCSSELIGLYDVIAQAPPVMPQKIKEFDASARTWLSGAGMPREIGNSLVNAIGSVITATHGMTEDRLQGYAEAEYAKLEDAYGADLPTKLEAAAQMVHALEQQRPGLVQLLRARGVGDNAMVASMLIQAAER